MNRNPKCHVCNRRDGWGLTMLDKNHERRTICKPCHQHGCENCRNLFGHENPPMEHLIYDSDGESDEAQVWCRKCHEEAPDGP